MGYVVIGILLCFSSASCYLASARPMLVSGSPSNKIMATQRSRAPAGSRVFLPIAQENNNDVNQVAGWATTLHPYFGSRSKMSIWGSSHEHSQESGASITIYSGSAQESFNCIQAGLHVFPDWYNSSDVHFFVYWTRDGFQSTGCTNLRCPGFVPAKGAALVPGQPIAPSVYGGKDRYITISLYMDPSTGDWVLYREDLATPSFLGHFPKELFTNLNDGADVGWFAFVDYRKNEPGPPMGSGHFPKEGERKAAYFKKIQLFDSRANAYDLQPGQSDLTRVFTQQECYNVSEVIQTKHDGTVFYYGGPSGCVM
ncbi:hypothetical protein U9M48_014680 [Paspalum notatum var. saurae]|uniref:Neprosin PEP catalytic domain-containing protein n=1 Tax=Paspalum notatum var. saurae TaxID=547442 RepID=A0AAQ3WL22_PASNO